MEGLWSIKNRSVFPKNIQDKLRADKQLAAKDVPRVLGFRVCRRNVDSSDRSHQSVVVPYEPFSKLLVSLLINPIVTIVVPYIFTCITPFKEFRMQLIWCCKNPEMRADRLDWSGWQVGSLCCQRV